MRMQRLQGRAVWARVAAVYGPGVAILAVVAWFSAVNPQYPLNFFLSDPASTAGQPFFLGILSQFGVSLLFSAGAVCLFASRALFKGRDVLHLRWFFLAWGLFICLLALDDMAMIHERVIPKHVQNWHPLLDGLGEKEVFIVYGLIALGLLGWFRREYLKTDYKFLLFALGCLSMSVAVDRGIIGSFILRREAVITMLEDGFKFLGIIGLLYYFAHCGVLAVLTAAPDAGQVEGFEPDSEDSGEQTNG